MTWANLKTVLAWAVAIWFVISLGRRDDTDPPDGRSGLRLFTDSRTGCQYLSAGFFGGIAPRLDASGKHVGCRS